MLAAEMAAEGGVHYLPLEECLMQRGLVEDLYPPIKDRCGRAGQGGRGGGGCAPVAHADAGMRVRLVACKVR